MNNNGLFATEDQFEEQESAKVDDAVESQKFLIFNTDNLRLGVDAESVVEIITNHTITYLPMMPDFVRGIINLRGQIIPIVDIRLRLGKESIENALVIVLSIHGTQIGILVDAMDQMVDIPKDNILPMPAHSVQRLVSGMCALPDGGTMMILDYEQLLPHE